VADLKLIPITHCGHREAAVNRAVGLCPAGGAPRSGIRLRASQRHIDRIGAQAGGSLAMGGV
jgi:hypothetical protein